MDYSTLEEFKKDVVVKIAEKLDISVSRKTKKQLIDEIRLVKDERYKRIRQIGTGKDAVTYLVKLGSKNMAMKTFKPRKSVNKISAEASMQQSAFEVGISPKVIDVDLINKYIVMEKLDRHMVDIDTERILKLDHQTQLVKLYEKLDEIGIFHGDPNPLNYMLKGKKLYVIDFGMSKIIDKKLIKKLGTDTPNMDLMTTGMVIKLIKMGYPRESYSYILDYMPMKIKETLGL